jgi:hypothetical protein
MGFEKPEHSPEYAQAGGALSIAGAWGGLPGFRAGQGEWPSWSCNEAGQAMYSCAKLEPRHRGATPSTSRQKIPCHAYCRTVVRGLWVEESTRHEFRNMK